MESRYLFVFVPICWENTFSFYRQKSINRAVVTEQTTEAFDWKWIFFFSGDKPLSEPMMVSLPIYASLGPNELIRDQSLEIVHATKANTCHRYNTPITTSTLTKVAWWAIHVKINVNTFSRVGSLVENMADCIRVVWPHVIFNLPYVCLFFVPSTMSATSWHNER